MYKQSGRLSHQLSTNFTTKVIKLQDTFLRDKKNKQCF